MTKVKSIILAGLAILNIGQMQAQFGTGFAFNPKAKKGTEFSASGLGFSSEVPAAYSLRMYSPYVKSQGVYPSCSGWAVSYEALSIQYAIANGITNRNHITAKAFCPYYSYNKELPLDPNCTTGKDAVAMMNTLKNDGAKKFYLPLMGCGSTISDEFAYASKYYKIKEAYELNAWPKDIVFEASDIKTGWRNFFNAPHPLNLDAVKQLVANQYPVVLGMALPTSFYSAGELWEPTADEKADPAAAVVENTGAHRLHAMTVIGYDDKKYGGAFEVMNSWSESWGQDGYFWVKYDDFKMYVFSALVMELFPTEADIATKTGVLWGDCSNGYGACRFANGQTYEGQFKDGKYHGYGVYTWPNGQAYAGQFKDGKRDGEATCYYAGGTFGQATYADDKFVSGYNELLFTNGDTYKGYMKNGNYEGYGEYKYATGEKYLAMFSAGNINGLAKYFAADGSTFLGYYSDGKRNGKGIIISSAGKISAGDWVYGTYQNEKTYGFAGADGMKTGAEMSSTRYLSVDCQSGNCLTGEGKRMTGNGNVYEGTFVDGLEDGKGKMNYGDYSYEGAWKQGECHGIGEYKASNGITLIAEFKKGKIDGYALRYDNLGNMAVDQYIEGLKITTFKEISATPATGSGKSIPENQKSIANPLTSLKK